MLAVVQRVSQAQVSIDNQVIAKIGPGFAILLGVVKTDTSQDLDYLVKKISQLRILADKHNKMNLSLKDINGQVLIIPQFTLAANTKKGNRPSFTKAADPQTGKKYFKRFVNQLQATGLKVSTGKFASYMQVNLTNDGPVTIIIDSKHK